MANARAVHFGLMIGLALGLGARAAVDLPPQELLLSRPSEGLPDLPVRRAPVPRRASSARSASTGSTWRRTPPSSSTWAPAGASTAPTRASSTSTAAAPRWRRSSPSPTCAPPEQAGEWLQAAAQHAARARGQRREHGGGLAALRRQHLAAPGRQRRARGQDGAQEHELLPLHRTRDPRRDRAARRRSSRPAGRSSRRRCTSTPTAARSPRCAPRRRRTTTATSPTPTWSRWRSCRR